MPRALQLEASQNYSIWLCYEHHTCLVGMWERCEIDPCAVPGVFLHSWILIAFYQAQFVGPRHPHCLGLL